jgi:hypothetical protein
MGCVSNAAGAWAAELAERAGASPEAASRLGAATVTAGTAGKSGRRKLCVVDWDGDQARDGGVWVSRGTRECGVLWQSKDFAGVAA